MKYLILIVSIFVFASCSKSDKSFEPLDGYYSLRSISCECSPIEIVEHQQQWFFDFNTSEIIVKTFGDVGSHLVLEAGIYEFELLKAEIITPYDSTDLIKVGGHEFGFLQSGGLINLTSTPLGIADLPAYIFTKN